MGLHWWLRAAEPVDEKEQWRQWLESIHKGETRPLFPGFEEEREYIRKSIVDLCGSFEGLRILGAGCGTGRMEAWLASQGGETVCLDCLPDAIQVSLIQAKRIGCEQNCVVGDIEKLPFRHEIFDLIHSGGVLEHFEDPKAALDEYFRCLKQGGFIIVSVPNLIGVNSVFGLRPLRERLRAKNRPRRNTFVEKDFSGSRLRQVIEESGFVCLDISPTLYNAFQVFPFRPLGMLLSILHLDGLCRRLLWWFGRRWPGLAFGYSFMIACAGKPKRPK